MIFFYIIFYSIILYYFIMLYYIILYYIILYILSYIILYIVEVLAILDPSKSLRVFHRFPRGAPPFPDGPAAQVSHALQHVPRCGPKSA